MRIRPQTRPDEDVRDLVDDPWKVLPCPGGTDGCEVTFTDEEFRGSGRQALYYVRAIEAPSLAVDADPLGCTRDAKGACVDVSACFSKPWSDDCLSETEERAWSSPIFVQQAAVRVATTATAPAPAAAPPAAAEIAPAPEPAPAAAPEALPEALPLPDPDQLLGGSEGSDGA